MFADTKGVIRNRKLKMVRQHNDQSKKDNVLQSTIQKTKDRAPWTNSKPVVNSCTPDDWAVPAPYVAPVVLLLLQTRGVFNDNELNICDGYPFETWNTCTLSKEEPITTRQMTLWFAYPELSALVST
jgi:hypothetical protein